MRTTVIEEKHSCISSASAHLSQYTIRITPDDDYEQHDVIRILKDIPRIPYIVIAVENARRPHFHVLIRTPMCRAWVFNIKKKYFPKWKSKKNEVWSTHDCNVCDNPNHKHCKEDGLTYVCKDGDIPFYRGFTEDEIATAVEVGSSLKPKPKKKRDPPIAEQIVKLIDPPLAEGVVPSGEQVLNAMILFYDKRGKFLPSSYHTDKTLHQIAMLTNKQYRVNQYRMLKLTWDNGIFSEK